MYHTSIIKTLSLKKCGPYFLLLVIVMCSNPKVILNDIVTSNKGRTDSILEYELVINPLSCFICVCNLVSMKGLL